MIGSQPRKKVQTQTEIKRDADIVLSVKNLSKKFCKPLKRNMLYGVFDLSRSFLGLEPSAPVLRKGEFWAVDDVSFELRRGQVLGIIGPNGSGKTTLLRLISGIFPPDKGEIWIKGRISILVSLGIGFHPHMNGYENIYINGALLGMKREEIDSKIDSIIEFSDLKEFMEAPISTYSQGMRVRLGFAIAIATNPDILLLDEVLAVGDRQFRAKCLRELDRYSKNTGIIFVSHHKQKVERICTDVMVMNRGKIEYQSQDVSSGINFYYSQFDSDDSSIMGSGKASVQSLSFYSNNRILTDNEPTIQYLDDLALELKMLLDPVIEKVLVDITFSDNDLNMIANCSSKVSNFEIINSSQEITLNIIFSKFQLSPGKYSITISIGDAATREFHLRYHSIKNFNVAGNFTSPTPLVFHAEWKRSD